MIIQFESQTDRANFMSRVELEAPQLVQLIKPSYSQPTVATLRQPAAGQEAAMGLVRRLAGHGAKVFDDVAMDVMNSR